MFFARSSSFRFVVACGVIGIREEKIGEEKKKRSGQAGVLVPKATTTARVSLPPFATWKERKCISPREVFLLRARSMNLPWIKFYLPGSYCTSAGHGSNYNKETLSTVLHCVVLIEYPRPPPRIILVESARSRCWILFLLPEADQILDLGRRALQVTVDMLSASYDTYRGCTSGRRRNIFTFVGKKTRLMSPNLYR